jgi:hypothetical protein
VRSRWGAIGGEGGDHFLVGQPLDRECVGDLAAQQTERGIELVGAEKAQHVGGDALAQTDFDTGVRLAEAGEHPRDVEIAGGQQRSDPDASAQNTAKLVDFFAGGLHFREHTAGSRGDRGSRLGRLTRRLVRSNRGVPSDCFGENHVLLRSPATVTLET